MSILKPYCIIGDRYRYAALDIRKRIEKRLSTRIIESKYRYILDNGHGGIIDSVYVTPGKRSQVYPNGDIVYEGDFNRSVVWKISSLLNSFRGIKYSILVPGDVDASLTRERIPMANDMQAKYGNCILLSIHANAHRDTSAHGFEVWTYKGDSIADKLATNIANRIKEYTGMRIRSDFDDGDVDKENTIFAILRKTTMPSLLTENGFMTNREDARNMLNPEWIDRVAWSHFLGILELENLI